jgi:hypothetical protein
MRPLELTTKHLRKKLIEAFPTSIQDSVSDDHHKLSTPEVRIRESMFLALKAYLVLHIWTSFQGILS